MIEEYFGLIRAPFKLSADPYFYFDSATHRKALSYLQYGIQQAEGFVVITGDTGVGKTTLVDHLLVGIDDSQVLAAKIDISHIQRGEALANVLSAFRIEPEGHDQVAGIEALEEFLNDQYDAGRQVVLIVDEAQNLSPQTLEELRVLTNVTREGLPLLQIFLVGQSEMKTLIARDDMEQFRQRVIASYHVSPLTRDETAAYIDHRLFAAGFEEEQSLFTDKAQDLIYRFTGGVPRKINKLCARVLLQTALDEKDFVDAATVQQVIDDFSDEMRQSALGKAMEAPSQEIAESNTEDGEFAGGLTEQTEEAVAKSNVVPFAGSHEAAQEEAGEQAWKGSAVVNGDETYQRDYTVSRRSGPAVASTPPGKPDASQEKPVMSVLDRLRESRKAAAKGEVYSERVAEPEDDDNDLKELARQIHEQSEPPVVSVPPHQTVVAEPASKPAPVEQKDDFSQIIEPRNPDARTRMDALKIDLNNFVNEVRDGLHDVENSMRTVTERIQEIERYRESRSRLLHDRLQEIEILLSKLQGRK